MKWLTSAPANLMIMGEHSVVYGYKAIATAIDKRIFIEWESRADNKIIINSELSNYESNLNKLEPNEKLQWVITTLEHFSDELEYGFNIKITSQFGANLGLGSSAAVLAAMIGGLHFYLKKEATIMDTFSTGLKIIHKIQRRGSGTDLAASLVGGGILFNPIDKEIIKIANFNLPLNLIYSGYKTPTAQVLKQVHKQWQQQPEILQALYKLMGKTTEQAYVSLQTNDLSSFYQLLNTYQGLMDALGVNDLTLSKIIYATRNMPQIKASKISGSGLGDCVLSIGKLNFEENFINQLRPMRVKISAKGLICESL